MQSQWLNLPLELGKSKGESNDPLRIRQVFGINIRHYTSRLYL